MKHDLTHEFFLGFIKIHILHHAAEQPVYGLWLIEELGHHGYRLSPGTLYPLLHSLEKENYLKCQKKVIEGKIRKYYRTTAKGWKALSQAKDKIRELIEEVVS
ncbi:MAG TPA: PadR family transcriptional regulator [Acidobacteria bacterium]|nr:PadR family transcriptional regulator [Acidobacteriota bacterium]